MASGHRGLRCASWLANNAQDSVEPPRAKKDTRVADAARALTVHRSTLPTQVPLSHVRCWKPPRLVGWLLNARPAAQR